MAIPNIPECSVSLFDANVLRPDHPGQSFCGVFGSDDRDLNTVELHGPVIFGLINGLAVITG